MHALASLLVRRRRRACPAHQGPNNSKEKERHGNQEDRSHRPPAARAPAFSVAMDRSTLCSTTCRRAARVSTSDVQALHGGLAHRAGGFGRPPHHSRVGSRLPASTPRRHSPSISRAVSPLGEGACDSVCPSFGTANAAGAAAVALVGCRPRRPLHQPRDSGRTCSLDYGCAPFAALSISPATDWGCET